MEIFGEGMDSSSDRKLRNKVIGEIFTSLYITLSISPPLSPSHTSFFIPDTISETDVYNPQATSAPLIIFQTGQILKRLACDSRSSWRTTPKPQIKISTNRRTYFWKMLSMLTKSMRRATPTRSFSAMSEMNMNRFDDAALKVWKKKTIFSNARNGEIFLRDPPPLLFPPNHSVTL